MAAKAPAKSVLKYVDAIDAKDLPKPGSAVGGRVSQIFMDIFFSFHNIFFSFHNLPRFSSPPTVLSFSTDDNFARVLFSSDFSRVRRP